LHEEEVLRVKSMVTSLREARHITNVPLEDIPPEIFLRSKGVFVACPWGLRTKGIITPIRVGQSVCFNTCWHAVEWSPHGDLTGHVDCLRARGQLYKETIDRGERPKNKGHHSMVSRNKRAFDLPTARRRNNWVDRKTSKDYRGLEHGVAWSAVGRTFEYPRPYHVRPWDASATSAPAYDWDDRFPTNFKLLLRQFMNKPQQKIHQIDSRGYYNALWRCMYDAIRQDEDLSRCAPQSKNMWRKSSREPCGGGVGRRMQDQVPAPDTCFEMTTLLKMNYQHLPRSARVSYNRKQ
jgi:hypothetical protein